MPRTSRATQTAREQVIADLKNDHKRVKKAYKEFEKLGSDDPEACRNIVEQVLQELQIHAALEEELLYPAAREALKQADLVDEAEIEHESAHTLMDQLRSLGPDDEKYAARFTVLCEYVLHHVKEEEGELFPALEQVRLDWEQLAEAMTARREELMSGQSDDALVATGNGQSAGSTLATNGVSDEGLASSRKL